MDSASIRTRRQALGLTQQELAGLAGVSQSAVSQWEASLRHPQDPRGLDERLTQLEEDLERLTTRIIRSASRVAGCITLTTYSDDATYWERVPGSRPRPASMHRIATARAAATLKSVPDASVTIIHEPLA